MSSAGLNCLDSTDKETFVDLGYTLAGYDILKGYPMEPGHDPGFSKSIFKADYSIFHQTADCKYVHIINSRYSKISAIWVKRLQSASDTYVVAT